MGSKRKKERKKARVKNYNNGINKNILGVAPHMRANINFGDIKKLAKENHIDISLIEDLCSDDTQLDDVINYIDKAITKINRTQITDHKKSLTGNPPRRISTVFVAASAPVGGIAPMPKTEEIDKLTENTRISEKKQAIDKNSIVSIIGVIIASISMIFTIKASQPDMNTIYIEQRKLDLLERMVKIAEEQSKLTGRGTDATELQLMMLKEMLEFMRDSYTHPNYLPIQEATND